MTIRDFTAALFFVGLAMLSLAVIIAAPANNLHGNAQLQAEVTGFDALANQLFSHCNMTVEPSNSLPASNAS